MPRRKKKKIISPGSNSKKKTRVSFNPLKGDLAYLMKADPSRDRQEMQEAPVRTKRQDEEDGLFLGLMSDVTRLEGGKRRIARQPDPNVRPAHAPANEELEVLAHLSDLVSGVAEIDIIFTDEYIEGCTPGFSPRLMERLKKGDFPVQDHIDLHGLNKQEAETRVREFLIRSYRLGLRCVLIVHGRGLNSQDHIPVLKERLPSWLNRGPINKIVLAFSTARPYDGGAGAIYVLLRRWMK
ncbi:Smr domain protein [uncultured Desulfobacterium sp.]|uniref:Smr domain protein n=1 Tax=uncultured Desulfobacterium sp. TaxID=201089 RepID=A0A445MX29_9BACT|nr:Smr domain protein [uncultured Desulfobacterium sp.]